MRLKEFIRKNIDKKRIITTIVIAFIFVILSVLFLMLGVDETYIAKNLYPKITKNLTIPVWILLLGFVLVVLLQHFFTKLYSNRKSKRIRRIELNTNTDNSQWTGYHELPLDGYKFKSLSVDIKLTSNFIKFGVKLLAKHSKILNDEGGVITHDKNILIHIGKGNNDDQLGFVAFKNGKKDMQDKKELNYEENMWVNFKIITRGNNNLSFLMNGRHKYSAYIEDNTLERCVLMIWGDHKHTYKISAENIKLKMRN